jgi:ubiquinone/menaquinone biosynthesis C-methylase UbiE
MTWDQYANAQPISMASLAHEPVQLMRLRRIARRCVGTVLDVGAADGYGAWLISVNGHDVTVVDISATRVERAEEEFGLSGHVADACALPFDDGSFDTVILGEILEHLENPGLAIGEAVRVARERVIISLPLRGWEDPTHQWRVSLDTVFDPQQRVDEPTKGEQIVLTLQRGECWPEGYWRDDEKWSEQFNKEAV